MIQEIGIESARNLIDYSGGDERLEEIAEQQLQGAVALHNILVKKNFAYLADEVGMGKTYTALGVAALFKHFNPEFRILYIAPRQNIQEKWRKELFNFTKKNWRAVDNIVKSFKDTPAYGLSSCSNLLEFVHQSTININRDFLLRLTSFSLPLSDNLRKKRDELVNEINWLDSSALNLYDKDDFKQNYAKVINSVIPHFDFVIVDESHNLKHGLNSTASRNQVLSLVLGHDSGADKRFPDYKKRFDKLLLLSATPLENDYVHLWNQVDLFGFGESIKELKNSESDSDGEVKDKIIGNFLIRRINGLHIGDKLYTKNMYRREWRHGGLTNHDEVIEVPDEKQRMIVGLIQKKVSEVIGNEKFNNSFQIGMLSSFESFLQTSKYRKKSTDSTNDDETNQDDKSNFDNSDQTESNLEKEGIDTPSIDKIADSYYRKFNQSLPHPKMDQVSNSLKKCFDTGEKSLVFVRRVASVYELQEKLNKFYDMWLKAKLDRELPESAKEKFEEVYQQYLNERKSKRKLSFVSETLQDDSENNGSSKSLEDDKGEISNFFTWFFRGFGPEGVFSGGSFNKNRLNSEGSVYSTLFEDNYSRLILGEEFNNLEYIAKITGWDSRELSKLLRISAYASFKMSSKSQKFPFKRVYFSYQEAIVNHLANHSKNEILKNKASVIRRLRFKSIQLDGDLPKDNFPSYDKFIDVKTFFTEIEKRKNLTDYIFPLIDENENFEVEFIKREKRRELISAVARLGHPMIDLWLLAVKTLKTIDSKTQDRVEGRYHLLIQDYLDLLQEQKDSHQWNTYSELSNVSKNFDLIITINFPEVKDDDLVSLSKIYGIALSKQSPVRGMAGGVNKNFVRQFRMPGYPLIMVTTEVLQEGEDLHTFCSNIIHYGIAWNPSSMEQRTGRIDRIHSLTHRRLNKKVSVKDDEFIQVYYPHLRDTVELLQVERVFEKMNKFIRMMHQTIKRENFNTSKIDTNRELLVSRKDIDPITEPLESSFPVKEELLLRNSELVESEHSADAGKILKLFDSVTQRLKNELKLITENSINLYSYIGTCYVKNGIRLLRYDEICDECRNQPFELYLKSVVGYNKILLHCVSPIGKIGYQHNNKIKELNNMSNKIGFGKICLVDNEKIKSYDLSIEADILFHPDTTQFEEVLDLVERTVVSADNLEKKLLGKDESINSFLDSLSVEVGNEEN